MRQSVYPFYVPLLASVLAESSPTNVYPDSLPKELDSSLEFLVCEGSQRRLASGMFSFIEFAGRMGPPYHQSLGEGWPGLCSWEF